MRNKIKFIQKNIKKIVKKISSNNNSKPKTLFKDDIQEIELLKKDKYSIKINDKNIFIEYYKKPRNNEKIIIFTMEELLENDKNIYKKIVNTINKIYELYKYELMADIEVNNYDDYFDTIDELICNDYNNKIITNMPFSTSKLSSTINVKQSGEEYGFGRYSSISTSFSITMAVPVEKSNKFAKFAKKIITKEITEIMNNIKGENNEK